MEKDYSNYSIEKICQEDYFIEWVKDGKHSSFWQNLLSKNDQLSRRIEVARDVVKSLDFKEDELDEISMIDNWNGLNNRYLISEKSAARNILYQQIFKYTAIILIALIVGATLPTIYFINKSKEFSEIILIPSSVEEPKLILADGNEVILDDKLSNVEIDSQGAKVTVDNDDVISLSNTTGKLEMNQVVVPYGTRSNIKLNDGTKVWLNAGSKLIFPQKFLGNERKVFLLGEAYFDVTKNENMPFVVQTNNVNVSVLGTEFNLRDNNSDDELEVVLVEGKVSLKENTFLNFLEKETVLLPNQKAVYNKLDNKTKIETNIETNYYTSWKDGVLEFKRESIINVFKRLSMYYNVRFVTEKSVELNQKISGKLDLKKSIDEVMKVVDDAAPITYEIDENKVIVKSKIK